MYIFSYEEAISIFGKLYTLRFTYENQESSRADCFVFQKAKNSSNQRLGSAFYRIYSVIMEKWVVRRKANRKSWSYILRWSRGLESMYTKTRSKAPEKT